MPHTMRKTIFALLLAAVVSGFGLSARAQTFGGIQTNFANIQCPTNSAVVYTNVYYLALPSKNVVFTNMWTGQSNFIGSWVMVTPAQTNLYTFTASLSGITNATWQTNITAFLTVTNTFFWHADPGTNGDGSHWFTNGVYIN